MEGIGKVIPSHWKELQMKPPHLWSKHGRVHQLRSQTWQDHPYSAASANWKMRNSRLWTLPLCFQFSTILTIFWQSQSPSEDSVRVRCLKLWGWRLSCILRKRDVEIPKALRNLSCRHAHREREYPNWWEVTGIGPSKPLQSDVQCVSNEGIWFGVCPAVFPALVQSPLPMCRCLSIGMGRGILCHCMLERYNLLWFYKMWLSRYCLECQKRL